MKLNKYEKRFIRMMAKTFLTIPALIIIMVLMGVSKLIVNITGGVMLVIAFFVKQFYWNYMERLELEEEIKGIV